MCATAPRDSHHKLPKLVQCFGDDQGQLKQHPVGVGLSSTVREVFPLPHRSTRPSRVTANTSQKAVA